MLMHEHCLMLKRVLITVAHLWVGNRLVVFKLRVARAMSTPILLRRGHELVTALRVHHWARC